MTRPLALQIASLDVRYGGTPAVRCLDLDVAPGTIHVVLGASGSGKTTLLRALAGFERAARGSIRIGGETVDDADTPGHFVPPERRGVGMVFQDYALFPHLTAARNVAFGMEDRSTDRATAWLDRVGLGRLAERRPAELSGGEQQRVAVARALARAPRLVLLDEPFSNLDPARRADLRAHTRQTLRDAGVTALLVTHTADEAFELGDTVSVLHEGRCLQTGTPDDLYRRPRRVEVARALGDVQTLPGRPGDVPGCVHTEVGALPAVGDLRTGDVLLRPEQLVPRPAAADDPEAAAVLHRVDRGQDVELLLRLPSGATLRARVRPWDAPAADRVRIDVRGTVCCLEPSAH